MSEQIQVAEFFGLLGVKADEQSLREVDVFFKTVTARTTALVGLGSQILGRTIATAALKALTKPVREALGELEEAASAETTFKRVEAFAEEAQTIDATARSLGMGAESWQAYAHAAEQAGVDQGKVIGGINKVREVVGGAARGNEGAAKTLRKLGLSVSALNKMSAPQQFEAVLGGLARLPDDAKRSAMAAEVLGLELSNALDPGRLKAGVEEAKKLGLIVPQETINKATAFRREMSLMRGLLKTIERGSVSQALPALLALVSVMRKFLEDNREVLELIGKLGGESAAQTFQMMAFGLELVLGLLSGVGQGLMTLVEMFGGVENAVTYATVASVAFFIAWQITTKGTLMRWTIMFILRMKALVAQIYAATLGSSAFHAANSNPSTWAFILGRFKALGMLMTGIVGQTLALTAALVLAFALVDDMYVFMTGGDSLIGEMLGIDPSVPADMELLLNLLLAIGLALVLILGVSSPVLALFLAFGLALAYMAARWDEIGEGISYFAEKAGEAFDEWLGRLNDDIEDAIEMWEDFKKVIGDIIDGLKEITGLSGSLPDNIGNIVGLVTGSGSLGDGAQLVTDLVGGGAKTPALDTVGQVFRTQNNRALEIRSPIQLTVTGGVENPQKTGQELGNSMLEVWQREISNAYAGEEF